MRQCFIFYLLICWLLPGCQGAEFHELEDGVDLTEPFCGDLITQTTTCPVPWLPDFRRIHRGAVFELEAGSETLIDIGTSGPGTKRWRSGPLVFERNGRTKVYARYADTGDCTPASITRTYEVVEAYEPAAGVDGSTAISKDDDDIAGWATDVVDIEYGDGVDEAYQTPDEGLGTSTGRALDIVALGEGGVVTLGFDPPIANGEGPDFAVFENSFNGTFLELAFVEVSSDGEHFIRFPSAYLGTDPVSGFGVHDPELISGLAGKYRGGFGTPFDLSVLAWSEATQSGVLDLHRVTQIRLVDIPGDGRMTDSFGNPIFDPYPTVMSAGFDLDAIGVLHTAESDPCPR